jgi:preprotein translocase subunit SecE
LDKIKLIISVVLIGAGIAGFYYYADQALLYRVLGLLAVIGVAAAITLTTQLGSETLAFGRNAVLEVRRSVWPTRAETIQTTLIVLVMVIVVGLMLWLFDTFLLWAVKLLTGQGG